MSRVSLWEKRVFIGENQEKTPKGSLFSPALQHFEHFHVIGIGRWVVVSDVVILLRRLENQRDVAATAILHQPLERRLADVAVPYENVPIAIGPELVRAVVQMKK